MSHLRGQHLQGTCLGHNFSSENCELWRGDCLDGKLICFQWHPCVDHAKRENIRSLFWHWPDFDTTFFDLTITTRVDFASQYCSRSTLSR
jgi:hypothetical protein